MQLKIGRKLTATKKPKNKERKQSEKRNRHHPNLARRIAFVPNGVRKWRREGARRCLGRVATDGEACGFVLSVKKGEIK